MKTYESYLCTDLSINKYEDGLIEFGQTDNCLNKCLEKLFPNDIFIHNKFIKNNNEFVLNSFGQKIRPDYFCEKLNLIIEYDGYQHYTKPDVILKDEENTIILRKMGYKVIRIPFYVQLDSKNIEYFFKIKYNYNLYNMCFDSGFKHPKITLPSEFCELGLIRFYNELWKFPSQTVLSIIYSLGYRLLYVEKNYNCKNKKDSYYKCVIPESFYDTFKYLIAFNKFTFNYYSTDILSKSINSILDLPIIDEILHEDINSMETINGTLLYISGGCDINKIKNKYKNKSFIT